MLFASRHDGDVSQRRSVRIIVAAAAALVFSRLQLLKITMNDVSAIHVLCGYTPAL